MTMIDTADTRFPKAVAIADQAGQWLKCRTADGHKAYGIRSSRDPSHVYFVTAATFWREIRTSTLAKAQFSSTLSDALGDFHKPERWNKGATERPSRKRPKPTR